MRSVDSPGMTCARVLGVSVLAASVAMGNWLIYSPLGMSDRAMWVLCAGMGAAVWLALTAAVARKDVGALAPWQAAQQAEIDLRAETARTAEVVSEPVPVDIDITTPAPVPVLANEEERELVLVEAGSEREVVVDLREESKRRRRDYQPSHRIERERRRSA